MATARRSKDRRKGRTTQRPNPRRVLPTTEGLTESALPVDAPVAFVIMPFSLVTDIVFEKLIRPLATAGGYRVERADTTLNQRAIMKDVVSGIMSADLILADLTGRNANVFYELGLAHAFRRPVILLAQSTVDIPFDLKAYRVVIYSIAFAPTVTITSSMSSELPALLAAVRAGEVVFSSPVEDYGGDAIAVSDSPPEEGVLDVMVRFQETTAPEATAAMAALGELIVEATEEMNVALGKLPESNDDLEPDEALALARAFADEIGAIWERSADRLEPLVNGRLVPTVLAVEADVSALIRSHQRSGGAIDLKEFFDAVTGMAEPASTFASTVRGTIASIVANSQWSSVQLKSGSRLAALYDRIASNTERLVSLADSVRDALGPLAVSDEDQELGGT